MHISSLLRSSILGIAVFSALPTLADAAFQNVRFSNAIKEQIPEPELTPTGPEVAEAAPTNLTEQLKVAQNRLANVTIEDLQQDVELAGLALNIAMLNRNWDAVDKILPIYKSFPNIDNTLVDYAQGALYREAGDYKKAIDLYRKLISEDAERTRVRMDLAILLFADKQDVAARDQFVKLRGDPELDEFTQNLIDDYLDEIDKRAAWSFNAGVSYVRDDNVNNASKSKIIKFNGLEFVKTDDSLPQSAQGFDYFFGAAKDFNISGSNYLSFDISSNGKVYWDNHKYDDANFRIASGYKYKDARNNFSVTPFAKFRYVHSKPYSKTFGASLSASRWFSPNWQLSNYNEIAWEKSDQNPDEASERQLFSNLNVLWVPKSTQYFVAGINVFDVKNENKAASYIRPGMNFVWNQDWPYGVSSRVDLGFGYKSYKDIGIFGVTRKDKEYNAGLTLWNRDWHVWGITPKLAFKYNNIDSNIDEMYSYDKGTVFLKFDKTF